MASIGDMSDRMMYVWAIVPVLELPEPDPGFIPVMITTIGEPSIIDGPSQTTAEPSIAPVPPVRSRNREPAYLRRTRSIRRLVDRFIVAPIQTTHQ
jgi:hypothetical protein